MSVNTNTAYVLVLQSLTEFYDDQRQKGVTSPHEAEFRAYHIITHLRDADMARQVQALPVTLRSSREVVHAMKLYTLAQRSGDEFIRHKVPSCEGSHNLFARFFKSIESNQSTYLMACLCETHFGDIRKGAIKSLRKAYISQTKWYPVADLVAILGCDDSEEAARNCEHCGLIVDLEEGSGKRTALYRNSAWDGKPSPHKNL